MSKALTYVPHPQLLSVVIPSGITDPMLPWLSSYLTQRSQVASTDGITSTPRPVTSGAVHGSALGFLIFLVYSNDALNSMSHAVPLLLVDDKNGLPSYAKRIWHCS